MNNYINDTNYQEESTNTDLRYSLNEEKEQMQWIHQVAKQAAKLISEQLNEYNNNSFKTK